MIYGNLTERESEIVRLLAADPAISVTRLSEIIGVSAVTIRSNLNKLAKKNIIMRTHGGGVPAFHPNVVARQMVLMVEKNRIARAAAALVNNGDSIMIEAGTTTALIPQLLLGKHDIKIVTNSTLILPSARTNPALQVTLVGGEFRSATESVVGSISLAQLDDFHVRLAFVGTDGFTIANGLTTHLVEGAEIVRKMAERSDCTILVVDSSKWGKRGFVKVLPLKAVEKVITDKKLADEALQELKAVGLEVILV
ncbi:MAG: DeoR family transcriptional regulator [Spirochaeta sp.]|nr:DeoR family transcriptional regulator [Spirochaeta sp.]